MGNQTPQRLDLASQAATTCQNIINALHYLQDLAERRPYLDNFQDEDFANTDLAYLDAGTIGVLFDFVIPSLLANYADSANSGRNKQILNQVAKSI